MKKLILILFTIFFCYSHYSYAQESNVVPMKFTMHNWIIGWGVDFDITLKNDGDATAHDITLRIDYTVKEGDYKTYKQSVTINWGEDLIPTVKKLKEFSYQLPNDCIVVNRSAKLTIISQ